MALGEGGKQGIDRVEKCWGIGDCGGKGMVGMCEGRGMRAWWGALRCFVQLRHDLHPPALCKQRVRHRSEDGEAAASRPDVHEDLPSYRLCAPLTAHGTRSGVGDCALIQSYGRY